jgi:hypothetical protein
METLDERLREMLMELDATRELYETLEPFDKNGKDAKELQAQWDEAYDMIQENIDEINIILKNTGKTLVPNLIKR